MTPDEALKYFHDIEGEWDPPPGVALSGNVRGPPEGSEAGRA